MTRPDGLRVTKVERSPAGYWTAHASMNGTTVACDRRYGSWRATHQLAPSRQPIEPPRVVLPAVASALQAQVRILEKRETRKGGES